MIDIHLKIDDAESSPCSVFAYSVGKLIEGMTSDEILKIKNENALLQGKILYFHLQLEEPLKSKYAEYFNIKCKTKGRIK